MWEPWVRSLGREDPLEKEMVTHSSILAWRIPWTEEPGRLQSTGWQRVGHDRATSLHFTSYTYMLCLVVQSCPTLWNPWTVAHKSPLSIRFPRKRMLNWVAMPSSRGSSWPRDRTSISCLAGEFSYHWATWEVHKLEYSAMKKKEILGGGGGSLSRSSHSQSTVGPSAHVLYPTGSSQGCQKGPGFQGCHAWEATQLPHHQNLPRLEQGFLSFTLWSSSEADWGDSGPYSQAPRGIWVVSSKPKVNSGGPADFRAV